MTRLNKLPFSKLLMVYLFLVIGEQGGQLFNVESSVLSESILGVSVAKAEIIEKPIEYSDGQQKLNGILYSDSSLPNQLPGVIVFSDWMGVGEFAKERAKELAALGYRAFVADIYGDGKQAKDAKEAGELATKFKADRKLIRSRAQAALKELLKSSPVDSSKVGAIGFCFGGTVALELVRDRAPLAGIVSFHGGLMTPMPAEKGAVTASLLVLHGADDPWVPAKEVADFEAEMTSAGATWQLVKYSQSVHAFTNPAAGNDPSKGAAYNPKVANRAYTAMRDFFGEVLSK